MLNFLYVENFEAAHKGVDILMEGIKLFLDSFDDLRSLKVYFDFCGNGSLEPKN